MRDPIIGKCQECGRLIYKTEEYYEFTFPDRIFCTKCVDDAHRVGAWDILDEFREEDEDDFDSRAD